MTILPSLSSCCDRDVGPLDLGSGPLTAQLITVITSLCPLCHRQHLLCLRFLHLLSARLSLRTTFGVFSSHRHDSCACSVQGSFIGITLFLYDAGASLTTRSELSVLSSRLPQDLVTLRLVDGSCAARARAKGN